MVGAYLQKDKHHGSSSFGEELITILLLRSQVGLGRSLVSYSFSSQE